MPARGTTSFLGDVEDLNCRPVPELEKIKVDFNPSSTGACTHHPGNSRHTTTVLSSRNPCATKAAKAEITLACSQSPHFFFYICQVTIFLSLFYFQYFKRSNVFTLSCVLSSLSRLKLKHCQMNRESCKHRRNTVSEAEPLYMNCMLSCQESFFPRFKHGRTCRKLMASLQICLKSCSLLFNLCSSAGLQEMSENK